MMTMTLRLKKADQLDVSMRSAPITRDRNATEAREPFVGKNFIKRTRLERWFCTRYLFLAFSFWCSIFFIMRLFVDKEKQEDEVIRRQFGDMRGDCQYLGTPG
jgi:hypothetical protein